MGGGCGGGVGGDEGEEVGGAVAGEGKGRGCGERAGIPGRRWGGVAGPAMRISSMVQGVVASDGVEAVAFGDGAGEDDAGDPNAFVVVEMSPIWRAAGVGWGLGHGNSCGGGGGGGAVGGEVAGGRAQAAVVAARRTARRRRREDVRICRMEVAV